MDSQFFEMLLPHRPLSHQTKNRNNLQDWKDYVYGRARHTWQGTPHTGEDVRVMLVYLCDDSPADVDNIIKPIQDGLVGVVLADDSQVADVDSHRRFLKERIDITNLPRLLIDGIRSGQECVYVKVSLSQDLEQYL